MKNVLQKSKWARECKADGIFFIICHCYWWHPVELNWTSFTPTFEKEAGWRANQSFIGKVHFDCIVTRERNNLLGGEIEKTRFLERIGKEENCILFSFNLFKRPNLQMCLPDVFVWATESHWDGGIPMWGWAQSHSLGKVLTLLIKHKQLASSLLTSIDFLVTLSICIYLFALETWLKKKVHPTKNKNRGGRENKLQLADGHCCYQSDAAVETDGGICSSNAHFKIYGCAATHQQTQERPCLQLIWVCASRGKAALIFNCVQTKLGFGGFGDNTQHILCSKHCWWRNPSPA